MIDSKELRIGNWVYVKLQLQKIKSIEEHDRVKTTDWNCMAKDLIPVPLTDEVLNKCGFDMMKDPKQNYHGNAVLNFGNPVLWLDKGKYNCLASNGGNEYLFLNGVGIPCQYLHQLQNLFFALTQTELKVEL